MKKQNKNKNKKNKPTKKQQQKKTGWRKRRLKLKFFQKIHGIKSKSILIYFSLSEKEIWSEKVQVGYRFRAVSTVLESIAPINSSVH